MTLFIYTVYIYYIHIYTYIIYINYTHPMNHFYPSSFHQLNYPIWCPFQRSTFRAPSLTSFCRDAQEVVDFLSQRLLERWLRSYSGLWYLLVRTLLEHYGPLIHPMTMTLLRVVWCSLFRLDFWFCRVVWIVFENLHLPNLPFGSSTRRESSIPRWGKPLRRSLVAIWW